MTTSSSGSGRLIVPLLSISFVPIWASGFVVGKLAAQRADVMTILFWRFTIAVVVMGVVALVVRPGLPRGRAWVHLIVAALLLQLGQFAGVYLGLASGVPAGVTSLLLGMAPLVVGLIAPLILPEKLGPAPLIGLLLGAAGAYIVLRGNLTGTVLDGAAVFPLLGMLSLAAGTLYQKRFGGNTPVLTSVVVQLLTCLLVTSVVMPFSGAAWLPASIGAWAAIGSLALVGSSLSFVMMFVLMRRVSTLHISGLLNLVPATVALAAVPVLGERLTGQSLLGLAVALSGLYLGVRWAPRRTASADVRGGRHRAGNEATERRRARHLAQPGDSATFPASLPLTLPGTVAYQIHRQPSRSPYSDSGWPAVHSPRTVSGSTALMTSAPPYLARSSSGEILHTELKDLFSGAADLDVAIQQIARLGARMLLKTALEEEVTALMGCRP